MPCCFLDSFKNSYTCAAFCSKKGLQVYLHKWQKLFGSSLKQICEFMNHFTCSKLRSLQGSLSILSVYLQR